MPRFKKFTCCQSNTILPLVLDENIILLRDYRTVSPIYVSNNSYFSLQSKTFISVQKILCGWKFIQNTYKLLKLERELINSVGCNRHGSFHSIHIGQLTIVCNFSYRILYSITTYNTHLVYIQTPVHMHAHMNYFWNYQVFNFWIHLNLQLTFPSKWM